MSTFNLADQINFLGEECGGPQHLISLCPEEMKRSAVEATGLYDFGNNSWEEGYNTRISSLQKINPHTLARLKFRSDTLRLLRNRLLIINEIKENPEVLAEEIRDPIFIVGNPRTGTTILFELLSQDQAFRSPKSWEINCPISLPKTNLTPKAISKNLDEITDSVHPKIKLMHELRWDLPTECMHIMNTNFFNFSYDFESHHELVKKTNPIESYQWHKTFLQLLQYKAKENKTWILKCPFHMHFLDQIYAVYPGAKIIHTHRDPVKSICSYINMMKSTISSSSHNSTLKNLKTNIIKESLETIIKERSHGWLSDKTISDTQYSDLMKMPITTIKSIYKSLGLKLEKNTISKIEDYLKINPQYRNGKYINKPEELGIEEEKIRDEFSFYIEHYKIATE